jgi:hypothetical protein
MSRSPETISAVDDALRSAAETAYFHAKCHEERGKTYCKPDQPGYEICKLEATVCREVGNAINAYRRSILPLPSPRVEAAIAAE